jgi:hypothetical protein
MKLEDKDKDRRVILLGNGSYYAGKIKLPDGAWIDYDRWEGWPEVVAWFLRK